MGIRIAVLLALVISYPAQAADHSGPWPRFRGPNGSGVAADQQPPIEVGPEKNVRWKVPVPEGLSSPIIVGDKLVITAVQDGSLFTIAYNRADGKEAWRAQAPAREIEAYHPTDGSPAASTPATDGEHIVSYFGSCGLFCYDVSGKELWRLELPMAATLGNYGSGVSPLIAEGMVVLLRDDANDSKIIACDVATGKIRWETKRVSRGGFSTPVVWEAAQGTQIVAAGLTRLIGYDIHSGQERWFVEGMPTSTCASPVTYEGALFFAAWSPGAAGDADFLLPPFGLMLLADSNGDKSLSKDELQKTPLKEFFDLVDSNRDALITSDEWEKTLTLMAHAKNTAFALEPGGTGDITSTHIRWQKEVKQPYVPSAIAYAGQYVMVKNGGIVTAYDAANGDTLYQKRIAAPGAYYASPVAANGHIYLVSLPNGAITVLKAGVKSPEIVAQNPPLGERVGATPAIADNTLYVRTSGHLYAFAESK